ncbi:MAG: hypothetical protein K8T10_01675 [Candidatus Eremiobacteraeota bacterium]|nr:hypothetical protein [Candidatus Eremiobacteraeota bacterium]
MDKSKGNILIYLLIIVLAVQVYIMFFNDPVILSKKGLVESKILLQGKDPGVPEPVPGQEPEEGDKKRTVQSIGNEPQPVVGGVTHGEGQNEPRSPLSLRHKGPRIPGLVDDLDKAQFSIESSEDYYKALIYGIIILEDRKDLAITKEQAVKLKEIIYMKSEVDDAVPEAQEIIFKSLTDKQLRYAYLRMCIKRGGSRPLSPKSIEKYSRSVLKLLKTRM